MMTSAVKQIVSVCLFEPNYCLSKFFFVEIIDNTLQPTIYTFGPCDSNMLTKHFSTRIQRFVLKKTYSFASIELSLCLQICGGRLWV